MGTVFVAFAGEDQDRVQPVLDTLKANGYALIANGAPAANIAVKEAVNTAACTFVLWSVTSTNDEAVRAAAQLAKADDTLIAGFIEQAFPAFGYGLINGIHLEDWNGGENDPAWQDLVGRINAHIAGHGGDDMAASPADDMRVAPTLQGTEPFSPGPGPMAEDLHPKEPGNEPSNQPTDQPEPQGATGFQVPTNASHHPGTQPPNQTPNQPTRPARPIGDPHQAGNAPAEDDMPADLFSSPKDLPPLPPIGEGSPFHDTPPPATPETPAPPSPPDAGHTEPARSEAWTNGPETREPEPREPETREPETSEPEYREAQPSETEQAEQRRQEAQRLSQLAVPLPQNPISPPTPLWRTTIEHIGQTVVSAVTTPLLLTGRAVAWLTKRLAQLLSQFLARFLANRDRHSPDAPPTNAQTSTTQTSETQASATQAPGNPAPAAKPAQTAGGLVLVGFGVLTVLAVALSLRLLLTGTAGTGTPDNMAANTRGSDPAALGMSAVDLASSTQTPSSGSPAQGTQNADPIRPLRTERASGSRPGQNETNNGQDAPNPGGIRTQTAGPADTGPDTGPNTGPNTRQDTGPDTSLTGTANDASAPTTRPQTPQQRQRQQDESLWALAQVYQTRTHYRAYLNAHPNGRFADQARAAIAELDAQPENPTPPPVLLADPSVRLPLTSAADPSAGEDRNRETPARAPSASVPPRTGSAAIAAASPATTGPYGFGALDPDVADAVAAARAARLQALDAEQFAEAAAGRAREAALNAERGLEGHRVRTIRAGLLSGVGPMAWYRGEWDRGKSGVGCERRNEPDLIPQGERPESQFWNLPGYCGEWIEGMRQGYGVYLNTRRYIYRGSWSQDEAKGHAVITQARIAGVSTPVDYAGQILAGEMAGAGVISYRDGRRYEGELSAGAPGGPGVLWNEEGDIIHAGLWANGEFVDTTQ